MSTHIWTDIDFDRRGRQMGHLYVPHSVTRSAYGHLAIPMAIVAGGDGPTALLTAGVHGDEYEGQIALLMLIHELDVADLKGRIIVVPGVNFPAALAGTRVSPIDDVNLNRAFPGDPNGSPTSQIAHYVDSVLLPASSVWIDLHSGGGSLDYLPFAAMYVSGDPELDLRTLGILTAFGAPRSVRVTARPDSRLAAATAHRRRVPYIGGEWGGGGSVSLEGLDLIQWGLLRTLQHLGIVGDLSRFQLPPSGPSRSLEWGGRDCYVFSTHRGLFRPAVRLGDRVTAGQLCGHVHFLEDLNRDGVPYFFSRAGVVMCQRHVGRTEAGDCLAHTMTEA